MIDKPGGRPIPWLLPDAIEEVLPPAAQSLEVLRRSALDACRHWGYELVVPPAIEYLEALLSGAAHDLDLQTFKLTDQLSGRMMGVRADITPQVARIDAHQLRRDGVVRLCYAGTVLRARPEEPAGSRNPLQLGAEVYGHSGVESDVEIIALMAEVLGQAGIRNLQVDLGHVGLFRGLVAEAALSQVDESLLWDALQRKATGDLAELLERLDLSASLRARIAALSSLNGGVEVLAEAREVLAGSGPTVLADIDLLATVVEALQRWLPALELHIDLGELRGYRYHTGVVFAAYAPGESLELARGGRYDDIGAVFGRARPATGFSTDLKALLRAAEGRPGQAPETGSAILAPWGSDESLHKRVKALRAAGEVVVWSLPGDGSNARAIGCDRQLQCTAEGEWRVAPL
ncbi:ATP phosphoribosyltransferase regulatory subunit [Spiribacter sp. 2438]|uniref:ATP phosphoribosyltransferase regulatory subunit n=1 Tax=Spiribacter sp. 2438 TaxID=2666185 RepID=UPI0012B0EC2F|nr:ATP phosphoribosyltransferase regulatory subunit [Spiribacter sp. 2438]QGM21285.1 ATP phosphoribosyltransferase regulatory subunit [Spiribacter sp. 2438]